MFYELTASNWDKEELEAMQHVIASGYFTMGEQTKQFEEEFARYFNMKYAIMVNSGSSANLIGVASLFYKKDNPLKPGDEVIVPAISWSTSYYPLHQYGLKLKFVDVELDTLNMDCTQLKKALTPRTRMILGVSILGNPAALDVMKKFAEEHNLYFFEDNCESCDAELNGKKTGTFGHINTFSFFFSHHISTMEGGMILTNSEELCHLAKSLRAHGWVRDLPADSSLFEKKEDSFFEAYRFILPGYNVRPIELSAAVGRQQLKKLPGMTQKRRENLVVFKELFEKDDRFIIQRENGKSSAFSFTMIINQKYGFDRKKVFLALKEADIGFRIITGGCFLRHDVIRYINHEVTGKIINANIAHDFGFFVGNFPKNITPQLYQLKEVLHEACQ